MPEDVDSLDESTPDVPASDSPDEGAPAESPAVNWEERYNNQQSALTRAQQEAAELRQYRQFAEHVTNPETAAEALRALGYEIEEDDLPDDDYDDDPTSRLESRLDQFESYLQQQADREAAAELQALEQEYATVSISEIEKAEGGKFSEKEKQALTHLASQLRDEDGLPDYEQAHKLLSETSEARRERYLKSKKADAVSVGTAGSEEIDTGDTDARVNLLANMLEAGNE